MHRTLYATAFVAAFAFASAGGAARAQAPAGADKLTAGAVADSLAVLRDLDEALRTRPQDALTWHRRGMIAWSICAANRAELRAAGVDCTTMNRLADTSLRIAADLAPDVAYYRLMAGRFLLTSGVSISRAASYGLFDAALETARKSGEPWVHSETAIEAGRVAWRAYDALADRWMIVADDVGCQPLTAMFRTSYSRDRFDSLAAPRREGARTMRDALRPCAQPITDPFSGEAEYLRAEQLFREALAAQPSNQRAYRQLAMLLVERNRWIELAALARNRLRTEPWDAWAYLTLGLTMQRQHTDARAIAAVFDSAMALLPEAERKRFARLERLADPRDTAKVTSLDPAERFAKHRTYWLTSVPLWSQPIDLPQLEFLSRVTYAELRWTVEEMLVRGAETDRGDVHIRYGPADLVVALRPTGETAIYTMWTYDTGLVFTFVGQPTFATAQISPDDQSIYAEIVRTAPVRWLNIRSVSVDSMPVRVARFRAQDSVDVVVAALPPIEAINASAPASGTARADFWLLAGGTVPVVHDSVLSAKPGVRTFTHRVAPKSYLFRTEASADGAVRAAAASGTIGATSDAATGFPTRGFGVSDVLIGTSAEPRTPAPKRWNDFDIAPLVGPVTRDRQLSLVWENYDFGAREGTARYNVTITLRRTGSGTERIGAEVLGAIARSVRIARGDDNVTMNFERTAPHAPIVVDNIALSLASTPPGAYALTITVTDLVTGRTAARTTALTIAQ